MLKSIFLALVFLLPLASPVRAADLSPAETAQVLARLQEHRAKYPSLTADFTEEKTSHLLTKPLLSQGSVAFLAPNKFRYELRGANPSTRVSNGQKVWMYYPNFGAAELYILGQRAFFDHTIEALTAALNFQNASEFYRCTASRETDGYRLVLTPKSFELRHVLKQLTVLVDDDYKIAKTITDLPQGDEVVTTYHNQRAIAVPASTFEFTPPPNTTVTQPLGK
jgi:outer membrane lipoprotein carrier protein